jgi:hypothetical protein
MSDDEPTVDHFLLDETCRMSGDDCAPVWRGVGQKCSVTQADPRQFVHTGALNNH